MSKPIVVTDSTFSKEVLSARSPVIVDFWAPWCGPCKMIAPILEDVAAEMGTDIKIAKVNVDENPQKAAEFGVRSIPTLVLFKKGKPVGTKVGVIPKHSLIEWIEKS